MNSKKLAAAAVLPFIATLAAAQTRWDMPTPYPDGNFHTKNAVQFAEDVAKSTGGKLQINVHSNGSLIKMPEIKRAVLTGQVPIDSVADLKGAKFRTYSPSTSRFAELMGAIPTTVQVPEIPQAFRTGLVDSMITSGATGVDTQAWDYLSHYYDTQAFLPQNMVIVNKDALAKLDALTQKALTGAARAAEERGWKTSESENERYVKTMADKGVKIVKPSARLSAEFAKIGRQIAMVFT